jgi:hypothetical protein
MLSVQNCSHDDAHPISGASGIIVWANANLAGKLSLAHSCKEFCSMLTATQKNCLALVAAVGPLVFISLTAGCQASKPAATAASPAIQLQPYTASDQSASAGVRSGWQVKSGADTVIQMTGPQGETVVLGTAIVARNGAFQAGQRISNGIDVAMPYTATLAQKLTMTFQQNAALSGKPAPQVTIDSSTPLQLPAAVGQCARLVADVSGQQSPVKIMAVFCSLPVDSGGVYKNILLLAQAPAAVAAQSAPTAQAIFQSYRIPSAWLQKKLAPFTAPPVASAAAAAMINRSTILGAAGATNSANCFDLSVLRETPQYDLPRSCGGLKPD